MMMSPLPDIDKTFALIIQQERELHSSQVVISSAIGSEESSALHLNTTSGNNSSKPDNNNFRGKSNGYKGAKGTNRVCTHCGRTNHMIETCFLKDEYPPGFPSKRKSSNSTLQSQFVTSVEIGQPFSNQSSPQSMCGFTQEQYQRIMELIQQSKTIPKANPISTSPFSLNSHSYSESGKNMHLWILDTDATNHITFDMSNFISYKTIISIHVNLPNGSHVTTSISGSVAISSTLVLHNPIYP